MTYSKCCSFYCFYAQVAQSLIILCISTKDQRIASYQSRGNCNTNRVFPSYQYIVIHADIHQKSKLEIADNSFYTFWLIHLILVIAPNKYCMYLQKIEDLIFFGSDYQCCSFYGFYAQSRTKLALVFENLYLKITNFSSRQIFAVCR